MDFRLHNESTAPIDATAMLAQTQQSIGMIPNLERIMASAPALLDSYGTLWEKFATTSLTPIEQQVVYQTINVEHGCNY